MANSSSARSPNPPIPDNQLDQSLLSFVSPNVLEVGANDRSRSPLGLREIQPGGLREWRRQQMEELNSFSLLPRQMQVEGHRQGTASSLDAPSYGGGATGSSAAPSVPGKRVCVCTYFLYNPNITHRIITLRDIDWF